MKSLQIESIKINAKLEVKVKLGLIPNPRWLCTAELKEFQRHFVLGKYVFLCTDDLKITGKT